MVLAEGELRELVVEVRGVAADELVGLRTFTFFSFLFKNYFAGYCSPFNDRYLTDLTLLHNHIIVYIDASNDVFDVCFTQIVTLSTFQEDMSC